MKHIGIILTSIAMVAVSGASFSGNARADGGQVAAGILGGLAARLRPPAPTTTHRSMSSLPPFMLSLIAIGSG
jgi:hypothetical protein